MKKNLHTSLFEYLKCYNSNKLNEYNSEDSFLSDYETAKNYAYDNIDGVSDAFDTHEENPDNVHAEFIYDEYINKIEMYVDKYNLLSNKDEVDIYRLVKLESIDDLDIHNIGKHWSFEKSGVGDYGGMHPKRVAHNIGKPFILEGTINPNDIDWVYGFHSFIWYGEDQWECALNTNAKITITKINDEELDTPILATVGKD